MIEGLMRMMDSDIVGPINLGNPEETSVKELAEKIIKLASSKSTVEFGQLPTDDPQRRQPNISQAKKELAWQPQVSLHDGLHKTIEYFQRTQSGPGGSSDN
jgi:UDP-glucuronate decarboxylase